jgi:hypothetical protein
MFTQPKRKICRSCGYTGPERQITKGSMGTEVLLWLVFFPVGILYSLWRLGSRYSGCPTCNGQTMIPLDSPLGKSFGAEIAAQTRPPQSPPTTPPDTREREDGIPIYDLDASIKRHSR